LLTRQMIAQAYTVLDKLHDMEIYQPVAINLVSQQALEPDLVEFIEQQIEYYDIPGSYLMIEVTEKVLSTFSSKAREVIGQLRALDVKISIDQFSGSYESLRYVRKMSVDQVKLNCLALKDKSENSTDKAIINSLVNLAKGMKLPLIGVNVDTKEVETNFVNIGGEIVQGNAISKGVVLEEFEIWLKRFLS